ncbi:MAG: hypothetical protein ACR2NN_11085 [Bryobacteraceae bacterium]
MSTSTRKLTWATVDFDSTEDMAEVARQDLERAGKNIRAAVHDLQERGIIDENGRRIRTDTPPDMREGSNTDFGG